MLDVEVADAAESIGRLDAAGGEEAVAGSGERGGGERHYVVVMLDVMSQ